MTWWKTLSTKTDIWLAQKSCVDFLWTKKTIGNLAKKRLFLRLCFVAFVVGTFTLANDDVCFNCFLLRWLRWKGVFEMSRTSAIVIAIVTHAWRLRLWLRSSSLDGDRHCDCDWKSCDCDRDCDCDFFSLLWLCASRNFDRDSDSNGDCGPVETYIFLDYDYHDSKTGSWWS